MRHASTNDTSAHFVNGRRVDYEFWRPAQVRRLAERLSEVQIGIGKEIQGTTFLLIEECFIHRLRIGVQLHHARTAAGLACTGDRLVDDDAREPGRQPRIATELAGHSAVAVRALTSATRGQRAPAVLQRLDAAIATYKAAVAPSRDADEGIRAFQEKRAPAWSHH